MPILSAWLQSPAKRLKITSSSSYSPLASDHCIRGAQTLGVCAAAFALALELAPTRRGRLAVSLGAPEPEPEPIARVTSPGVTSRWRATSNTAERKAAGDRHVPLISGGSRFIAPSAANCKATCWRSKRSAARRVAAGRQSVWAARILRERREA